MALRIQVSDLLEEPGSSRTERAAVPVSLSLHGAALHDEVEAALALRSLADGVLVRGETTVAVDLTCTRCLTMWTEDSRAVFEAVYRHHPEPDDELPIEPGGWIEVGDLIRDEVSLALPARPVCRVDCRGLCPVCGSDLNIDPCGGHGEEADSPFVALRDLFD